MRNRLYEFIVTGITPDELDNAVLDADYTVIETDKE